MEEYTISEASQICQLNASTLRYYEEAGLLPAIKRNQAKQRLYTIKDLELINCVKCFRELGLTVAQIKEQMKASKYEVDVQTILRDHLAFLYEKRELINHNIEIIEKKLAKGKEK